MRDPSGGEPAGEVMPRADTRSERLADPTREGAAVVGHDSTRKARIACLLSQYAPRELSPVTPWFSQNSRASVTRCSSTASSAGYRPAGWVIVLDDHDCDTLEGVYEHHGVL